MKNNATPTIDSKVAILLAVILLTALIPLPRGGVSASALLTWSISLIPDNGYPGATFTVKLKDFTGGYNAAIRWDGVDQVTFTMPASGQFATTLAVPPGASPGGHTVSACNNCGGGDFEESASTTFTVRRLPPITVTLVPPSTSTFTPVPPTHTFTPPPTITPTATPTLTPTITETPEEEVPSPSVEPTETEKPESGELALPGEVFLDQPALRVPSCTPSVANFSALISDPSLQPVHVSLLILPAGDAPLVGVPMQKGEGGVYEGALQLNEDSTPGDWIYSVIARDEAGVSYRSEMGLISVSACGEEVSGSSISDRWIDLIPYVAIASLAIAGFGLFILGSMLIWRQVRRG